jgi:type IV pilus assembly protein PilY1
MSEAKKVIKKLVDTIDLTNSAQFGLQTWSGSAYQRVKVDADGANRIYQSLDPTDPLYSPSWYNPSGWTNLDRSMQEAYDYFMGNKPGVASPIKAGASCQKSFLIVVSDGVWRDTYASRLAKSLYDQKGVITFVIGFHASGGNNNYIKLAKAGQSWPDSPLYSDNWQHLYETLSDYIRTAISSRLTFSAPVIMPNIASGNHIFQSTFTLKNNKQWQGQLSKYKLTAGGQIGALQWDAGAKLNDKSESSRQIWTIANHHGVSTSMNNFNTSNLAGLKEALWELFPSDASDVKATNLINFVRGIDAYDENANNNTTEKRWKLGDIYNSKLAVVGAPKAKIGSSSSNTNTVAYYRYQNNYSSFTSGSRCGGSCATRTELVYVGANDGMLHAFDSGDGEELWAFVPPNMLQSLKDMVSVKANSSNSIYGVDGTPVVKDIFYDNKWRTVLLSGMGKGGKGYFALDITSPTAPQFLFGFQNNTTASSIYHWDENGTRSTFGYGAGIPAEYDYSKVGYTSSTPTIVAMPSGTGTKWVAVFGAGDNAGINNTYGSAVYIIDLENEGKVLKRIDLTDTASNGFSNSVPASIVAITPDTTSKADYKGAMIYVADLESKQWKLNLTNKGTLYEFTPIFDAEATLDNDRMEFFQVTPSVGNDGSLWTFYGTGNQQKIQRIDNDISNRVFAIKDNNFPLYSSINGLSNTAQSSLTNSSLGACPSNNDMGWYVGLGTNKRVTGKLAIFNELVYSSEYLPNNSRICFPGKATLSEYSMSCGSKSRSTELGEGIATGAVIFNNNIYVGITGEGSGDVKDDQGNVIGKKTNNLIVITPKESGSIGGGIITQESWREIF